jgi:hypothetical protein
VNASLFFGPGIGGIEKNPQDIFFKEEMQRVT